MNAQDLRVLLEQSDDKLSVFSNNEVLDKYEMTVKEFSELVSDFLSDEEKLRLFDYSFFINLESWKKLEIIKLVSDKKIILQMLSNDSIMSDIDDYYIADIINKLDDNSKKNVLYNHELIEKLKISDFYIEKIILSLSEDIRTEILRNKNLIENVFHLRKYRIANLVEELTNEEEKLKMLDVYDFDVYLKVDIIKGFNSSSKIDMLMKEKKFNKYNKIQILQSFDIKDINDFLEQHKDFCNENNIHPYEIISKLDIENQKEFITKFEDVNLSLNERREILATLNPEVKQSIDTTGLPEEYKSALKIQTTEGNRIDSIDFESDLENYRGLDSLIKINPEKFTKEQRTKFLALCDICPKMDVTNTLVKGPIEMYSTAAEYKEAEKWINSIIEKLDPNYSQAQKLAVIDNEIGKRISYSPDFDTGVSGAFDSRALWKIISSGYGVCNGIARVEKYILDRVGIESEMISSGTHSFLKIKEIELPLANGEVVCGNTILDPTWNMAGHRFGGKPNNFCISYEQARKNDIDSEGKDHYCHKNDKHLQDATINLDEESLKELFKSVGLTDKDGNFPSKYLIEKSKQIDMLYANQLDKNIKNQFLLLKEVCPEFITCQNSSMRVLRDVLLDNENLNFNRCVIHRGYARDDKDKKPTFFVYIDSNEIGKKFFVPNNEGEFIEFLEEEFTKKYECYETDLEKNNRT